MQLGVGLALALTELKLLKLGCTVVLSYVLGVVVEHEKNVWVCSQMGQRYQGASLHLADPSLTLAILKITYSSAIPPCSPCSWPSASGTTMK